MKKAVPTPVPRVTTASKPVPSTTARPMERAEPASIRTAASRSVVFMSCIFCVAISRSCAVVTRPIGAPLPGAVVPFSMPAAFFRN